MSEQDTAQVQQRFREAVSAHWAAVRRGDSAEADQHEELNELVVHTTGSGKTSALIALLGEQERPEVRTAAATYALHHGHADQAIPVLQVLVDSDDIGFVAEDADLALTEWRRHNPTTR